MFESEQDDLAAAVMGTFRLSGVSYFYEDGTDGARFAFDEADKPVEETLVWRQYDQFGRISLIKKGRSFLFTRAVKEKIDAWRISKGYTLSAHPLFMDSDFIVALRCGKEQKYQIDTKNAAVTLGVNEAVYKVNTFLSEEQDLPLPL